MPYVLLAAAVACEVFGTSMMKLSNGFERKLPVAGIVVGYALAFALIGFALQELPLGLAYGIWGGAGAVLTAVVGAVFWSEGMSDRKISGIALVVLGIFAMEIGATL